MEPFAQAGFAVHVGDRVGASWTARVSWQYRRRVWTCACCATLWPSLRNATFGRTAARLHVSQPPLSRAVKQLEADLGLEHVERCDHARAGDHLCEGARLVAGYAPGSWVTSTSSVRAPPEAVRCAGRLLAVRRCGMSLPRTLVSGRAAVGWSSFRCDGTFLWTHEILPAGNLTAYPHPLSGAGRSRRPPRTCAALSAPARCAWAAAAWHAAVIIASTSPVTDTSTSPPAGPAPARPTPPRWSRPASGSSAVVTTSR
jgi:hypothetical protein